MSSSAQHAQPASASVFDPHKKRCLKTLQRLIAPRRNLRRNRIHALAVEIEKLSLIDLDARQKNATQFRLRALAIVAHVPSGACSDLRQRSVEGSLQRQIVRHLSLPPHPSHILLID